MKDNDQLQALVTLTTRKEPPEFSEKKAVQAPKPVWI
jgi:hypothetical protein